MFFVSVSLWLEGTTVRLPILPSFQLSQQVSLTFLKIPLRSPTLSVVDKQWRPEEKNPPKHNGTLKTFSFLITIIIMMMILIMPQFSDRGPTHQLI